MLRAAFLIAVASAAAPALAQAPLVVEGCIGCHGPRGTGSGAVPPIAGREASDLAAAMAAFRGNERPNTIMGRIVRGYTEAEVAASVAYFAAQR